MNLKCTSKIVYIEYPGHGTRTIDKITVGNVYQLVSESRQQYVNIIPDHGTRTIELPRYLFEETDEAVTANPLREEEDRKSRERETERLRALEKERQDSSIREAMDQYYNPSGYRRRKEAEERTRSALSEIFVQGISY